MKPILNVGPTYTYVPRRIFLKYPGLDLVAQASGNYLQNMSKQEHDVQLMLKIAGKLEQKMSWDSIKESVKKTKAKNLAALPGMFNFLRKFGGEGNMGWARASATFIRGEVNTQRKIGPDVWDAMGLDVKGSSQLPRLRHGLLCLMYTDSSDRLVTPSDIKSLSSKDTSKAAVEAEGAIESMFDAIAGSVNTPGIAQELGKFGATCAALVTHKKGADVITQITKEFNVEFDNLKLGHLQWLAIQQINKLLKTPITLGSEHLELEQKSSNSTQAPDLGSQIVKVRDAKADMTAVVMEDAGWKVGDVVEHRDAPDVRWAITKFVSGQVIMESRSEPKTTQTVAMEQFQEKQWAQKKEKEDCVLPGTTPTIDSTKEYQFNLIRSVGIVAIHEAKAQQENITLCSVRLKPGKAVEVIEDVPKGKLQLAPLTTQLTITEKSKCKADFASFSPSSLFLGSFAVESKQYCMFAAGVTSCEATAKKDALLAPFWAVKTTDKESDANCKLSLNISDLKINPSKISSWMENESPTTDVIKIPTIVSNKALKKGDTLTLFQPRKKQRTQ